MRRDSVLGVLDGQFTWYGVHILEGLLLVAYTDGLFNWSTRTKDSVGGSGSIEIKVWSVR